MPNILDWSRFSRNGVGPERAFEAFAAQLFERWLRREYPTRAAWYALRGAGGDGGVEAFARLDDDSVVGLQAKWFPENLDDRRVKQIRESIDTALKRFPRIRRYVIAMPQDLTKGLDTKRGPRKGGVERWEALVAEVRIAHPDVVLVRWDETAQITELSVAENHELKSFWFEGEFTAATLRRAWEKARARLESRYVPDLHAVGLVDATLRRDLRTHDWLAAVRPRIDAVATILSGCAKTMVDFAHAIRGKSSADIDAAVVDVRKSIGEFVALASSVRKTIDAGLSGFVRPVQETDTFAALSRQLTSFEKTEPHLSRLVNDAIESASAARTELLEIAGTVEASGRLRLIAGPAGCGKTHAAASAVHRMIDAGCPAIFLMGQGLDPSRGAADLFSSALDLPGWSLSRILDGLEAHVILQEIGADEGQHAVGRALVVLDGLEESVGWQKWAPMLADLVVETRQRPRLHVVATARPETFERIATPKDVSWLFLDDSGGADLPEMLRRYAERYSVNTTDVPWLGWALRTPLEIRLLAEEFDHRRISASEGATTNLLTLFRRKLRRLESEARDRAGIAPWSEGLDLVGHVLRVLSDLLIETESQKVQDSGLVARLVAMEPEFTAGRVRDVLRVLVEHGLVSVWWPPSEDLLQAPARYGLATRHVSDFIVARQCFRGIEAELARGGPLKYPPTLRGRQASATLFAAQLAEQRRYVADITWEAPPADLFLIGAEALALVPFEIARERVGTVRSMLTQTTSLNRSLIQRLVLPCSRIPDHPLGVKLLDQALRLLPLAKRDPIWAVPEDLAGDGPWDAGFNGILDDLDLNPVIDRWSGRPLLVAWTCASVVESRRMAARERLAVWGARRLDEMVHLVEHMAQIDDAQVVGDVIVAALGAVVGAPLDDVALLPLARLVDELFFVDAPKVVTTSVVVRTAGRGIIERAALLFPSEATSLVTRCRPPHPAKGDAWPAIDVDEGRHGAAFGGTVVHGDLSWYVAESCFRRFSDVSTYQLAPNTEAIHAVLLDAVREGRLALPPEPAEGAPPDDDAMKAVTEEAAKLINEWRQTAKPHPWDDPRHSPEFRELMRHARDVIGGTAIDPKSVRNGMIAAIVRRWGWSEEEFAHRKFDDPVKTVDHAIVRAHGHGATHGSRSPVCTFREKYVWAAVDLVAGALADRMPVWSREDGEWKRLTSFGDIGNGLPDPLPHLPGEQTARSWRTEPVWEPRDILPMHFENESDLACRAERWLTEAPLSDPATFLHGRIDPFADAAILSLAHFRSTHQSCIDQSVHVRAFAVRLADVPLIEQDPGPMEGDLHDAGAGIDEGVYISPALACWAPWASWVGLDHGYETVAETGAPYWVKVLSLVGQFTTRFEGEWPREQTTWIAAPYLAQALGIVTMRGGRHKRIYSDSRGNDVIVEYDPPGATFSHYEQHLAMDRVTLRKMLAADGMVSAWAIRVWRDATPALYVNGSVISVPSVLTHRRRDTRWLVLDLPAGEKIILLSNELEAWKDRSA